MISRRHRNPRWFVDPSKVTFGSVVQPRARNVSRSHVRVRYRGKDCAQFIPLGSFIQHCQASILDGHALDIEHLLIAPVLKRRHAHFFDALTDWGPAAVRARTPPSSH